MSNPVTVTRKEILMATCMDIPRLRNKDIVHFNKAHYYRLPAWIMQNPGIYMVLTLEMGY